MNEILVGALKACEGQVEDASEKFQVVDLTVRSKHLDICMGNPIAFLSAGAPDTESR